MITIKIAFVLRLVDDFSGKTIVNKKFVFRKEGRLVKPIQKEEGLYVFLEPMNDVEQIEIEGPEYHTCVIEVTKAKLDKKCPILNVRLYGKKGGKFSYTYSLVEGTLKREKEICQTQVCVKKESGIGISFKEIKIIEGRQHLVAYGFTKENILGKTFGLSSGNKMEVFVITDKIGINEYVIEGELTGKYPDRAPVQRIYRSVTDANGRYAIPVPEGELEQLSDVIML